MENPQPTAESVVGAPAGAQPVTTAPAPAVTPAEPAAPSQSQPAQVNDAEQAEVAAWLQSKGIEANSPEAAQALAKMAFNSEKQMTKATQEASELKKSLTPELLPQPANAEHNPMEEFAQDYKRDKLISGFKETHDDWKQHEPAMASLLTEAVQTPYGVFTRAQLVNEGLMSLEDVYARAKLSSPADTAAIQTQAKQEVLQTLANTQRAGGGNSHASNSNPQAPTTDPITEAIRRSRGQ